MTFKKCACLLTAAAATIAGAISTALGQTPATQPARPNVVFILADDLGWRDVAFAGSTSYHTPNLDALAASGMRFERAYSASPLCSPTRASLLTGQYPGRLRLTRPNGHYPDVILDPIVPEAAAPQYKATNPQTRTRLPLDYHTLGAEFKRQGYDTAFMGKWHLGRAPHLPEQFGFDVVVGGRENPGPPPPGYFGPWQLDTLPVVPAGTHVDDALADEAAKFIAADRDAPFLLCFWPYNVHSPYQAEAAMIERYRKANLAAPQSSAEMAAMVETMDRAIGKVLDTLKAQGIDRETIVVFSSDNGGNMFDVRPGGIYPTSNAPLRGGKGTNYEGGVRVPLVVRYDGVVAPGTQSGAVVTSPDFFPTLLDLAGLPQLPEVHVDGHNFATALRGQPYTRPEPIVSHFPHPYVRQVSLPSTSITDGDWKLYRIYNDAADQSDRFELYDLSNDPGETDDRAGAEPQRVEAMRAALDAHLSKTGALIPAKNPRYAGNTVGFWYGKGESRLSVREGVLNVEATGPDPQVITEYVPNIAKQAVVLRFDVRADRAGDGNVYWSEGKDLAFARERRKDFTITEPNIWHSREVRIELDGNLRGLRIDPLNSVGQVELRDVRLVSPQGNTLATYPFLQ
ncbi:MAG TPA: sulfatase [Tepidisphaeraceae bacterium]|jgi:arylsulfatase A-like enzyme|nr:sulfatase [Tepidisphaeraceae bacterium]